MFENINKNYLIIGIVVVVIVGFLIYYFVFRSPREEYFDSNEISTSPNQSSAYRLIYFYIPSCSHCKEFMDGDNSVWSQIVEKYKSSPLVVTSINCDLAENENLTTEYQIVQYPTIKLVNDINGQSNEYSGNRTFDDINDWINSNTLA